MHMTVDALFIKKFILYINELLYIILKTDNQQKGKY